MAIHKVIVTTDRGNLALSFTNAKAAREFASEAARTYGWGNIKEETPIVSYAKADVALRELYEFSAPIQERQELGSYQKLRQASMRQLAERELADLEKQLKGTVGHTRRARIFERILRKQRVIESLGGAAA